jgi:hypothetical protein
MEYYLRSKKKNKKKDGNAGKTCLLPVVCSQSSKQAAPGGGDWGLLLPAAASHRERHAFAVAEVRCFVWSKLFSGGSGANRRESPIRLVGYIRVADWWATGGRGSARFWPTRPRPGQAGSPRLAVG